MLFFFFNDTATTEIYTLSLHDALPISGRPHGQPRHPEGQPGRQLHGRPDRVVLRGGATGDRKSTRLNSSHANISYAVFCLKKNKEHNSDLLGERPDVMEQMRKDVMHEL